MNAGDTGKAPATGAGQEGLEAYASQSEAPSMIRRLWAKRPTISGLMLVVVTNLWLLVAYNNSFWERTFGLFGSQPLLLVLFAVGIWALTMVYVLLFTNRWLLKPFLIINILLAAGASYYNETLGIIVDRTMIQNVLGTTMNESRNLLTAAYVQYMLAFAVLPSLAVMAVRVSHPPLLKSVMRHSALLVSCVALFLGVTLANYQSFSFGVKSSPGMRKILHPMTTMQSLVQYGEMMYKSRTLKFEQVALDAHKGPIALNAERPSLTVLIIGETLRDQNWGLSGYGRNTAPELRKHTISGFNNVETCGTSTSISIPCMFSRLDRENFTYEKAVAQENLLDILQRAGYDVEWWDANTGHMGVAERIPYTNFNKADDPEFCSETECNDGILLKQLKAKAGSITRDTVIVLHQIGNHGPAYFERYPPEFAKFLPDCREADLSKCKPEHIVNAYDNAAAYTDYQLAQTIDFLSTLTSLNTSMMYISDHGESLGEGGLFLHAAPYWIAPEEQKRVPWVLWMSDQFRDDLKISYDCVSVPEGRNMSQDMFFHSVLAMLDVETSELKEDLDVFASCRAGEAVASNL